jgi:hypothetical protein
MEYIRSNAIPVHFGNKYLHFCDFHHLQLPDLVQNSSLDFAETAAKHGD